MKRAFVVVLIVALVLILTVASSNIASATNRDTDGDGLYDFYEDWIGTDRFNADTDVDGLSDGEEVLKYGSNPKSSDSDSDGLNDSYVERRLFYS